VKAVAVALGALALAPAAAAAGVDRHAFRYERTLTARGAGPIELEPDGPLYAHSAPGFADLRVLDSSGRQVPWRPLPEPSAAPPRAVDVLDSGRRGREVTALLDLGPGRRVHDRVELDLPGRGFVGRVTVLGSDDRRSFTRLSTTTVYDLAGARTARSTTVLFPRSDFRYLLLRGRGIPRIAGATVAASPPGARLRSVPATVRIRNRGDATLVTLDLGWRGVPVDELRITASTPRYDRAVEGAGAYGRIARLGSVRVGRLPVEAEGRFVRLRIENGDDEPLRGLRVVALARPRTLLVEDGHPGPLTVLYGARIGPPSYDYALLPRTALDLPAARRGGLAPEGRNPAFELRDTRSFARRHPALIEAALAAAAAVLVLAGVLALRRT